MNNLIRVQVYLDPTDVSVLDKLAKQINITRSQIIRDATQSIANRYNHVSALLVSTSKKTNPLTKLVGVEKSKSGTVGLNVDEIYFHETR